MEVAEGSLNFIIAIAWIRLALKTNWMKEMVNRKKVREFTIKSKPDDLFVKSVKAIPRIHPRGFAFLDKLVTFTERCQASHDLRNIREIMHADYITMKAILR